MLELPGASDCSHTGGKAIKIWKGDTQAKVQLLFSDEYKTKKVLYLAQQNE